MEKIETLVRAARAGDKKAFGEIVCRFQDMAYGYAYAILGDFHLAQDAAQEAFVEAYRNLENLDDLAAFPGWFKRIVRFRSSRLIRGKRIPTIPLPEDESVVCTLPGPDAVLEETEMKDKVLQAIESLSQPLREVTTLFYMNGYSTHEISDFLEVPVNTVKSRLHASRKHLKERMGDMVRSVLDKHRLPADFQGKIVESIPALVRGRSGETTYIAAVTAALSVTDRPFDYDSLMVLSGLAFRLRYVRHVNGREWSRVGPVGQFEEEAAAVTLATGCEQPWVTSSDVNEMKRRTVAGIDAGFCPTAYIHGDNGVIHGYEENGNIVYVRCHKLGEGLHRMTFEEMLGSPGGHGGPFFLEPVKGPAPEPDAFIHGARLGLINWHRGRMPGELWQPWRKPGEWQYCFGAEAYRAWIGDLGTFDRFSVTEAEEFTRAHLQAAETLRDARLAAGRYLSRRTELFGEVARPSIERASALYLELGSSLLDLREKGLGFTGVHCAEEPMELPGKERRRMEADALRRSLQLDSEAIVEIQKALVLRC